MSHLTERKLRSFAVCVFPSLESSDYLKSLYGQLRATYGIKTCSPLRRNTYLFKRWSKIMHLHWIEFTYVYKPKILLYVTASFPIALLFVLKKLFRTRIVVTLHNAVPHDSSSLRIQCAVFKIILSLSDTVFVHSDYAYECARLLYEVRQSKVIEVAHPSWIGIYPDNLSKEEARKRLRLPPEDFVLGFFGGMRRYKGIHVLLEAFSRLRRGDTWLVVAGPPSDRAYVKELSNLISNQEYLSSHVIFLSRAVRNDDVQIYVKASDVGVVPYTETTTPASLLLFMSFGVPVIAPKLPKVTDYFPKGTFFHFKANDVSDLLKTMKTAMGLKMHLPEMGFRARSEVQRFRWDSLAEVTYQAYLDLLSIDRQLEGKPDKMKLRAELS